MTHKPRGEPKIEWRSYPLIPSGEYHAYCRWAKQYKDPGFKSWRCLLRWNVLTDDLLNVIATVPQWFPLGDGEKPRASRRGKYLKEWVKAHGSPPTRGDRLSPHVFVGRIARVEVGITDPERSPVPYSVVRRIVSWETGEVRVTQSASHPVRDGNRKIQQAERLAGDRWQESLE